MKEQDCFHCRHGKVMKGPQAIRSLGSTYIQQGGAGIVTCTCPHIHNMSMRNDVMECSGYEEKRTNEFI